MFLDCTPGFNWPRSRKLTKNLLPWLSLYTQKKLPITAPFKNAFENYTVQTEKATLYKSSVLRIMGMDSKITIIMLFYCPWYRQCTNKCSVNAPAMVLWIWKVISNVSSVGPFMFLSDEGPTLETLDFTIRIGSTPTFFLKPRTRPNFPWQVVRGMVESTFTYKMKKLEKLKKWRTCVSCFSRIPISDSQQ